MCARRRSGRWSWREVVVLVMIVAAGIFVWRWRRPLWALFGDQARIRRWIAGFGPWGPLVSVGLNTLQVLLAPIPGQFVGVANGYLYGVWLGTLYSMIGLVVGRAIAMGLGRWFGRPLVERVVDPEWLARWDRLTDRQGPRFFFLIFLIPALPDDATCFLIGLTPLSIPYLTLLAAVGGLPGVFVSCWFGANANALPWWAWIPLGASSVLMAWLLWRYREPLEERLVGLARTLGRSGEPDESPDDKNVV